MKGYISKDFYVFTFMPNQFETLDEINSPKKCNIKADELMQEEIENMNILE